MSPKKDALQKERRKNMKTINDKTKINKKATTTTTLHLRDLLDDEPEDDNDAAGEVTLIGDSPGIAVLGEK